MTVLTYQTGLTVYGLIRRVGDGFIYDTVAGDFVTPVVGDIANYYLTLTEDTISKQSYTMTLSKEWDIGHYTLETYSQVGGSEDTAVDTRLIYDGKFYIQNRGIYTGYLQAPDMSANLGNIMNEYVTTPLAAQLDTAVGALIESVATGGSTTTLVDTLYSWVTDRLISSWIVITCAASGISYPRQITSNILNTYTFGAIDETVVAGDKYSILTTISSYDLLRVGGVSQTGADLTPAALGALQSATDVEAGDVVVLADTQGFYLLPTNTKSFSLTMIDGSDADVYYTSFTTGHVAPRSTEGDLHYGGHKFSCDDLDFTGKTIFFATTKTGGATFHIEVLT